MRFGDNLNEVVNALQEVAESITMDAKTKATAMSLMHAISSPAFLMSLAAAKKVMTLILALSRRLQSPTLDLSDGAEMVNRINNRL